MSFGPKLVVLHTTPSMFGLYQFIDGRTNFGMPRDAQTVLVLNEPK